MRGRRHLLDRSHAMTTLAERFTSAVDLALAIDTSDIRRAIHATHDRWPGGSGISETGVRAPKMIRCDDDTCEGAGQDHDHAAPVDPTGDAAMRTSRSDADLEHLDMAERWFVTNVAELVAVSASRGVPTTWDEAVQDAHLLVEMDAVRSAGQMEPRPPLGVWITDMERALRRIETIRDNNCARQANDWERIVATGKNCVNHARIGMEIQRCGQLVLCSWCAQQLRDTGWEAKEHHTDRDRWPSIEVMQAKDESDRTGKRTEYRIIRQVWVEEHRRLGQRAVA